MNEEPAERDYTNFRIPNAIAEELRAIAKELDCGGKATTLGVRALREFLDLVNTPASERAIPLLVHQIDQVRRAKAQKEPFPKTEKQDPSCSRPVGRVEYQVLRKGRDMVLNDSPDVSKPEPTFPISAPAHAAEVEIKPKNLRPNRRVKDSST